jgi:hypothetical protein
MDPGVLEPDMRVESDPSQFGDWTVFSNNYSIGLVTVVRIVGPWCLINGREGEIIFNIWYPARFLRPQKSFFVDASSAHARVVEDEPGAIRNEPVLPSLPSDWFLQTFRTGDSMSPPFIRLGMNVIYEPIWLRNVKAHRDIVGTVVGRVEDVFTVQFENGCIGEGLHADELVFAKEIQSTESPNGLTHILELVMKGKTKEVRRTLFDLTLQA